MSKFRKRPAVVEAVRWNGFTIGLTNGKPVPDERLEMPDWLPECLPPLRTEALTRAAVEPGQIRRYEDFLHIGTLEGVMACRPGDWIIRGVNGEIYPCRSDIFEKAYERVPDEEPARH